MYRFDFVGNLYNTVDRPGTLKKKKKKKRKQTEKNQATFKQSLFSTV